MAKTPQEFMEQLERPSAIAAAEHWITVGPFAGLAPHLSELQVDMLKVAFVEGVVWGADMITKRIEAIK